MLIFRVKGLSDTFDYTNDLYEHKLTPYPLYLFFPAPGANQLKSLRRGPARRALTQAQYLLPAG